jgi:hypothetical protein
MSPVENTVKNRNVSKDEESNTARAKVKKVTYAEAVKKGTMNNDKKVVRSK